MHTNLSYVFYMLFPSHPPQYVIPNVKSKNYEMPHYVFLSTVRLLSLCYTNKTDVLTE